MPGRSPVTLYKWRPGRRRASGFPRLRRCGTSPRVAGRGSVEHQVVKPANLLLKLGIDRVRVSELRPHMTEVNPSDVGHAPAAGGSAAPTRERNG